MSPLNEAEHATEGEYILHVICGDGNLSVVAGVNGTSAVGMRHMRIS